MTHPFRFAVALVLASLLASGCGGPKQDEPAKSNLVLRQIDFELADAGKLPEGFTTALTGAGAPASWTVLQDPTSPHGPNVLAQTSDDPTSYRFPLAIFNDITAENVAVTVAFKPLSGKVDQAAGIVVRLKDKDNYYIVRANALENNVRLYHFINGKRTQFAGVDVPVNVNQWHTLGLRAHGPRFDVTMNGKLLFTAEDSTLTGAGRVALWTKADSVTYFDRLSIVTEATR